MQTLLQKTRALLLPARPRVQVLSDLHLEVGQQYTTFTFPATAPFLLLAGDIGRLVDYAPYLSFLNTQTARFQKVLLVLGNHEFYGLSYEAGLATARRLAAEPSLADGVVLLHRALWDDPSSDLTILGCTLWSSIPADSRAIVEGAVRDFKQIASWTAARHTAVHDEEVAWLREQVGSVDKSRRVLVATHHAPCVEGSARPEQVGNPWSAAFSTGLLEDGGWEGRVRVWVFGNTHYSVRLVRRGVRAVANQRGYVFPGSTRALEERRGMRAEKGRDGEGFDAGFVVEV